MTISWFKEIPVVSIMWVNSLSSPLFLFCPHAALEVHFLPMGLGAPANSSFIKFSSINFKKMILRPLAPSLWVVKGGSGEHPQTVFILCKGINYICTYYICMYWKRCLHILKGFEVQSESNWNSETGGCLKVGGNFGKKKKKLKELSWCPVYGGWFFIPLMHSVSSWGFS